MMMKKDIFNKVLPVAMVTLLSGGLTACSNADDSQQTDDRVPITLTANTLTVSETRAGADVDLNKDYIAPGQTIKVRISNTGVSSWTDYSYDAGTNGTLTTSDIPPFYPMDGTNIDIVAYHPSFAENTFTVRSDQSTDGGYLASDLMFSNNITNQAKTSAAVVLQFEHKMAKVVVDARAGAGVSAIEEVTLHKVYPEVTFNKESGTVGSAQGIITSVKMVKDGVASTAIGAAAIPAQTIEGDLLTIKTNLGTATYSVDSKAFAAGKVYKLNITVNRAAINTTTQITGWTETANVSVNKEEDSKTFTLYDGTGHVSFTMIRVEGGPYTTLAGKNVTGTLSSFYIGKYEVTNALWWMVMRSKPANQTNAGNAYPVSLVTYNDIMSSNGFIAKLNTQLADQLDGMAFTLPTEAQWEYAARGGINQERFTYSGSNTLHHVAVDQTYNNGQPMPCGSLYANSLGIYDMSGNVWEFCRDYYQNASSIPTNLGHDYAGPSSGTLYQLRGGGFLNEAKPIPGVEGNQINNAQSIVDARWGWALNATNGHTGLRLVLQ